MRLSRLLCLYLCLATPLCPAAQKTIYLTIDDGPLAGAEQIINVVNTTKTPVTLFMVGLHVENYPHGKALLASIHQNPYIEIGNHSYYHAWNHYRYFFSKPSEVLQDLEKNKRILGLVHKPWHARLPGRDVFRLPTLKRDDIYLTKKEDRLEARDFDELYQAGFWLYGWDHEWAHDSHGRPIQSVQQLVNEIDQCFARKQTLQPDKLILLAHDEMFQKAFNGEQTLSALIKRLAEKGYRFDLIKNYVQTPYQK